MHKVLFAESAPPALTNASEVTKIINVFNAKKITLRLFLLVNELAADDKINVFLETKHMGTVLGGSAGVWMRFKSYDLSPLDADSNNYIPFSETVDVESINELRIKLVSTSASDANVFGDCDTTEVIL